MSASPNQLSAATPSDGAVSTPNRWPSCEHFQETVTLIVGSEKKAYSVHKDLLCFYSDYFRAAFKGSFKEAIERKIDLPGVTKEVFEHFQVWLYTRRFDAMDLSFELMVRLWIFGDEHQIPLLQNCAVDGLLEKRVEENEFDSFLVPLVYQHTLPRSALRRAVIEISTSLVLEDDPKTCLEPENWSVESLIDLVRAVDSRPEDVEQYDLPRRDKCFFHVHGKDEHC